MRSLVAPLALGLLLSLAAVFAVQWSAVHGAIDRGMRDFIAGELQQDADELASGLVRIEGGGPLELAFRHYDPSFLEPSSGRYYLVMVEGATALRSPSLGSRTLAVAPVTAGQRATQRIDGANGESLLVSANGYAFEGRPVTIAVAADLRPIDAQAERILRRYTAISVAMFALLVVLQVVIVRFALAPLRRVRADVSRLEHGEVTQLGEAVPAEVLPLVREVNRLLALLSERLRRSRESLGNLAHALKAPLTVLTQAVDDERIRREPALHAELSAQLERLRTRIDSELRRARVAGGRAAAASVDLSAELLSLAGALGKLHRDREIDIECHIDPAARFFGDREDLLELCGNLLDNACKWARSRVALSVREDAALTLTVEDDGPGCPEQDLERLARRGVRLDEQTAGHGLGLSIARDIAASYGGDIRFGRSHALGGFEVSVTFPMR
ncbi:MAG TPA: sensor histidine kinase [Usitatibacter sp.]|nr:sensor histidine kinase [Usitatibacter sp.]